ncbi:M48 family metallopeptidase [Acinetobacter silvestris]|uniref:YgjP-like metallopeptidase domain-containing protein n=1 Tax=Acinetobacter silvestris TaxID=1977882 RepID=A0A1Y3CDG4_9GAMM|nr:SprT family zinc-dependent metalloprotease [Acinetobacter silvestris]OTG65109.1 hypothetical protein B9T28_09970 [Acinetobacter silvestris]
MNFADLPEIKIVRHVRATRLHLRVEPTQIRLTAPVFCSQRQIQNFVDQSQQWLCETWQKQQQKLKFNEQTLPTELQLFNVDQPLQIKYQPQKPSFIFDSKNHLILISDRQPEQYLKAFIVAYAKHHLPIYLAQVSAETGLNFGKCSIRQPKTRWGSCTSKHDIMLNGGLVLFPQTITRYVCVHELAHTKHFDHSKKFWAEVTKHDIFYKSHQKILKTSSMPYWWFC